MSATIIATSPKATPCGDEKFPSPEPSEPNLKKKVPLGQNTWTRWLPVSATAIRPRSLPIATPCGDEKFPSPEPSEPNEKAWVPLAWKTCIRSLPVSATATTLVFRGRAFLRTATSSGDESSPSPEPSEPNTLSSVPFRSNTWTRWLPVSATKMVLSWCMAMPLGDEKFGSAARTGGGQSCLARTSGGCAGRSWESPAADAAGARATSAAATAAAASNTNN